MLAALIWSENKPYSVLPITLPIDINRRQEGEIFSFSRHKPTKHEPFAQCSPLNKGKRGSHGDVKYTMHVCKPILK